MSGFKIFLIMVTFGTLYWNHRIMADNDRAISVMTEDAHNIGFSGYFIGCVGSVREQVKIVKLARGQTAPVDDENLIAYCEQRAREFMDGLIKDKVK